MSDTSGRALLRTLGFSVLYALAGVVGRLAVMDSTNLSVIWPAAGVLAVWLTTQRHSRRRRWDVLLATLIVSAVCVLTGLGPMVTVFVVAANVLQAVVFVALFERRLPHLWVPGGPGLSRLPELWRFLAVAAGSTAVGALIGPIGVWITNGHPQPLLTCT